MSFPFWLPILFVFTGGFVAGVALTVLYFKWFEIPVIEDSAWRDGLHQGALDGSCIGWINHLRGPPEQPRNHARLNRITCNS